MVFFELKAVGADHILERVPLLHEVTEIKVEVCFFAGAEEIVQDAEPLCRVQFLTVRIQMAQARRHVGGHAVKKRPRFLRALTVGGQGDVTLLHDAVG